MRRWLERAVPSISASELGFFRVWFGLGLAYVLYDARLPHAPFPETIHSHRAWLVDWPWVHMLAARPDLVAALEVATIAALVIFAAGLATRVAYATAVAGLFVWTMVLLTHSGAHQWAVALVAAAALLPVRWGDGFSVYNQFDDLAFVIGAHMERYPLIPVVLNKLGAIVVDNCGGAQARRDLKDDAARAHEAGRPILIYPEGHLAPVGKRFRYRSGVWHMYRDFNLPVVPTATNLGLFWPEDRFAKHPGTAVLEFLEPIQPGLTRSEFMERLETAIETKVAELVAEARGGPVVLAELDVPESERSSSSAPASPAPT